MRNEVPPPSNAGDDIAIAEGAIAIATATETGTRSAIVAESAEPGVNSVNPLVEERAERGKAEALAEALEAAKTQEEEKDKEVSARFLSAPGEKDGISGLPDADQQ